MKRTSNKRRHSYSSQDKEQALLFLDQIGGNLTKAAKETGISVPTLRNWQKEAFQNAPVSMPKEMEKFIKNAWENIHSLSDPEFIRDLKIEALKKGSIKEIFASISILVDKMTILTRLKEKATKEAESTREENLTEEEIRREIIKEEKKIKKK